jgi:two-component system response regulator WspF
LATLLAGLAKGFPAAIVIVQHVDEKFVAGLAEWLGQHTELPVRLALEGEEPPLGEVLIAGTRDHMVLGGSGRLGYTPRPRDYPYCPSVDVFFESVAKNWRGDVAGVLLTGMGRDGAKGLKTLRNCGHYTIAQDQSSSAVYGMPKAAAALDAAVDILPLKRIAAALTELFPANLNSSNPS